MAYYDYSLEHHAMHGWFRVLYPDGQISQRMTFWCARAYSQMFGGKIVWHKIKLLTERKGE